MIILILLLLLSNLHLKLLSTQGTGADKLLSTQRVKNGVSHSDFLFVNIELYTSKKCVPFSFIKILLH